MLSGLKNKLNEEETKEAKKFNYISVDALKERERGKAWESLGKVWRE